MLRHHKKKFLLLFSQKHIFQLVNEMNVEACGDSIGEGRGRNNVRMGRGDGAQCQNQSKLTSTESILKQRTLVLKSMYSFF
jgi:hypothetical protein